MVLTYYVAVGGCRAKAVYRDRRLATCDGRRCDGHDGEHPENVITIEKIIVDALGFTVIASAFVQEQ